MATDQTGGSGQSGPLAFTFGTAPGEKIELCWDPRSGGPAVSIRQMRQTTSGEWTTQQQAAVPLQILPAVHEALGQALTDNMNAADDQHRGRPGSATKAK